MTQKIAVLGSGANGSCIAADLIEAGLDVTVVDQWPEHVEVMRANGLTIKMPDRELHVAVRAHHLCDLATFREPFDVVLLAVKAYDTAWSCELIKPHLAAGAVVVGMQNAMTSDALLAALGPERVIACVVELSSEMFTPGQVKRNVAPPKTWIGIGSLDPSTDHRLADIKALLDHVGRVEIIPDILSAKWTKLVINAMCLGPCAMLGLTVLDAIQLPGMRELIIAIANEAMRTGRDLGYRFQPIFGLMPSDFAKTNRPAELLFDKLVADIGPGRGRNTVLQDLLKGRASEVFMINGLVADESRRRGGRAPANAAVAQMIASIEGRTAQPSPDNLVGVLNGAGLGTR